MAGTDEPTVLRSRASVRLLIDLAAEYRVRASECLAGTDISATDLARPDAEVEANQELA